MDMEKIQIGVVGKAQGIKGEVKIIPSTDDNARFKKLKQVLIGETLYDIESVKVLVNGVFIKLKGIDDRNFAEFLKGRSVYVDKQDIKIPEGSYLIIDLIGCKIFVDDNEVGVLTDILQNGAADVYIVAGKRNFMFPALKDVLLNINIESKIIELNGERLAQIAVYDDEK